MTPGDFSTAHDKVVFQSLTHLTQAHCHLPLLPQPKEFVFSSVPLFGYTALPMPDKLWKRPTEEVPRNLQVSFAAHISLLERQYDVVTHISREHIRGPLLLLFRYGQLPCVRAERRIIRDINPAHKVC